MIIYQPLVLVDLGLQNKILYLPQKIQVESPSHSWHHQNNEEHAAQKENTLCLCSPLILISFRARANWAQENGYEAFPLFASAVIAAHVTQVPAETITLWAWVFVGARIVYIIAYLVDQPYIRSAVWGAGQCCSASSKIRYPSRCSKYRSSSVRNP